MPVIRAFSLSAAALTLAALCIGCGGSGRPKTVPVTGQVLLDGKPLDGAALNFAPEAGGRTAQAVTDASGQFKLGTFEAADGAVPGNYNVAITKMEATAAQGRGAASGSSPPDIQLSGPPGSSAQPKMLLPSRYASADKSGIRVEVKPGMEPAKIELTAK